MHKKTKIICGESELIPDFEAIGNNPNFVFENDPNFETLQLFDFDGNVVNVNSIECANYINGVGLIFLTLQMVNKFFLCSSCCICSCWIFTNKYNFEKDLNN